MMRIRQVSYDYRPKANRVGHCHVYVWQPRCKHDDCHVPVGPDGESCGNHEGDRP